MRKNSPKEKSLRLRASVMRGVLALVMVGLLVVPIAVQAELKATSLAYTWDLSAGEWEWGHATVEWDGAWIPLLQEVYFDHLDRPPESGEPQICADPTKTTQYAGWIEYGLPYLDTDPPDARGFQASDEWVLIDCDLDRDANWGRADLVVSPGDVPEQNILAECTEGGKNCNILYQDEVQDCGAATAEHCTQELATMLLISIDTDCDGEVDEDAAHFAEATALCVFSWALTPDSEPGEDMWTFPLPVRITDADGAKTLMLYPEAPTAVELASFSAEPQGSTVLVSWETATELDNLGFNLFRSKAGGERIRLNDQLIASQSPGSTVGSSYRLVDRSVEPGMAYQYWLEDIDLGGVTGMNGPVAVQMPRNRLLPCRPRPAPMPVGHSQ
jgi:hypothetical protein